MPDIIVSSSGFTNNGLYYEGFALARGEYMSIDFEQSLESESETGLCDILTGQVNLPCVSVTERIVPVFMPMMKAGPGFLSQKKSFKYLQENSSLTHEEIFFRLEEMKIDPNVNIYRLGGSERKLLALEAAYSKSKNIIISKSGIDYIGRERIWERIEKELDRGLLIELNYPTSKGREYFSRDSLKSFKKINVVPVPNLAGT